MEEVMPKAGGQVDKIHNIHNNGVFQITAQLSTQHRLMNDEWCSVKTAYVGLRLIASPPVCVCVHVYLYTLHCPGFSVTWPIRIVTSRISYLTLLRRKNFFYSLFFVFAFPFISALNFVSTLLSWLKSAEIKSLSYSLCHTHTHTKNTHTHTHTHTPKRTSLTANVPCSYSQNVFMRLLS